jgi:hypothetical protein
MKDCTCSSGPALRQVIPAGCVGKVTCAECHGLAVWPREEKVYKGNDPIEEYLFNMEKNSTDFTPETAIIRMLLRIEKAIRDHDEIKVIVKDFLTVNGEEKPRIKR